MEKVLRSFEFEVRAEHDEEHGDYLTGRPIVYDAVTNIGGIFNEVIERGALDDADLRDVAFLVNHDKDKLPLARSRRNNINSTMHMEIDVNGMAIRVNLDTENNVDAKALYSATKRGDISGMSFAFSVDAEEWTDLELDIPTRRIKSIGKVLEVSAVTWPAYDQTSIEARDAAALDNAKALLESRRAAKRDAETRNDILKLLEGRNV